MPEKFASVEDYLASLPAEVRTVLEDVRATIHSALPEAADVISYNMPAVTIGGRRVVHYAGWKKHVSLYPTPDPTPEDATLADEIAPYAAGRGTLKFPIDQPVPHDLVTRIALALNVASP